MEALHNNNIGDGWKYLKRQNHANGFIDVYYTDDDMLIKDFDQQGNFIGDRKRKRTITKRSVYRAFQSTQIFN
jgi:hypothetical protein